jgi:thiamine-monophosphate kinase
MLDVSDGLAKDLHAITPAGTAPALDPQRVPRRAGVDLRAALTEGEDYELLFAVSRRADRDAFSVKWRRAFPKVRLSWVGEFVPAGKVPPGAIPLEEFHGYEHLR